MSTKPPRATTKGDGKRAKPRATTMGERSKRSPSVIPTDQYNRISEDEIVEVEDLVPAGVAPLRMLVLEAAAHLAPAQAAITASGHVVVRGASGTPGLEKLRPALAELVPSQAVDALLVALPGGEPLIQAALAFGALRPIVIAASTTSGVEAARRAIAAGADLAVVRPHDVERLAPVLLAAAKLVEQRRAAVAAQPLAPGVLPDDDDGVMLDGLDLDEPDPSEYDGVLQPYARFQEAFEFELERAQRFAYPLSIAMFELEVAPPPPPPGVRGILRARTGNALVHAVRDIDLVTELERDRFLVLMPYTDRLSAAEVARKIIGSVAGADPVVAAGRTYLPKIIGAIAGFRPGEAQSFARLVQDATQLLEQAAVTGASLAVES